MARKNKKQRKHPKFWLGFKMVLLLFLLTILVGGIIFYFKYGKDIFAMQDDAVALVKESSIDTFRSSETSIVYNNKGKEIAKLKGEKDSYYLTLDLSLIHIYFLAECRMENFIMKCRKMF